MGPAVVAMLPLATDDGGGDAADVADTSSSFEVDRTRGGGRVASLVTCTGPDGKRAPSRVASPSCLALFARVSFPHGPLYLLRFAHDIPLAFLPPPPPPISSMHGVSRILKHSSKGAIFDRYTTIRKFFRQPPITSLPRTSPALFIRLEWTLHTSPPSYRQFSTHASLLQEHSSHQPPAKSLSQDSHKSNTTPENNGTPHKVGTESHSYEQYPRFFRRLALSLPHLQRPTRDDFLKAADGFWQRARIRFRWLTIRSFRKYNADEIGAFFTWFIMSQTLWLFIGT